MILPAATLALSLLSFAAQAAPPQLRITTEESLPAVMVEQGKFTGYAYEKLREAMRRSGITFSIELMPWMRSYTLAQQDPGTCVFPTTRTPDREKLFTWVAPVARTDWWLYGLANRDYRVHKLEDARQLRFGAYNGDVRGDYLKARGYQVDFASNDDANIRKLMLGRIDLWVASPRSAQVRLARESLQNEITPILMFNSVELYLACHPATPPALLRRLAAAFTAMERDGTSRAIEVRYDVPQR